MIDEKMPPVPERLLPVLGRAGIELLLDSHAAAALLGVHPHTLQRMVIRGQIARWADFGASGLTPSASESTVSKPNGPAG